MSSLETLLISKNRFNTIHCKTGSDTNSFLKETVLESVRGFFQNRERSMSVFQTACVLPVRGTPAQAQGTGEVCECASLLLREMPLTTPEQMLLTYTSSYYVSSQLHTTDLKMHELVHCVFDFLSIIKSLRLPRYPFISSNPPSRHK